MLKVVVVVVAYWELWIVFKEKSDKISICTFFFIHYGAMHIYILPIKVQFCKFCKNAKIMALFSYQNNCSAEIFCISFKCKWKICVSLGEPERVGENW